MKITLIVPSGGVGERVGADLPKQYLKINNKSILYWTLSKFSEFNQISQLIIPADNNFRLEIEKSVPENLKDKLRITPHGETRFNSIYNSIEYIENEIDYVIVHDAVRPFVDKQLINRAIEKVIEYKAIVPYITPTDTIKKIDAEKQEDYIEKTLDREFLASVQTPQIFEKKMFVDCYEYAKKNQYKGTDDSSILEYSNIFPKLILGDYRNIKITSQIDVDLANILLKT